MQRPLFGTLAGLLLLGAGCTPAPAPAPAADAPVTVAALAEQITGGTHDVVRSDGGAAELLIPQGALPPGTSAGQVRITPLAEAELPIRFSDGAPSIGFRLEPDGLTFAKPAVLRFSTPMFSDGTVPLVLSVSGEEVKPLRPVHTELDGQKRMATVSVPLSHFSSVLSHRGFYQLDLTNPGDHFEGESFTSESTLRLLSRSVEWTYTPSNRTQRWEIENPVISGEWDTAETLTPSGYPDAPSANTPLPRSDTFSDRRSFTCEWGSASIYRQMTMGHDFYRVNPEGSRVLEEGRIIYDNRDFVIAHEHFNCRFRPTPAPTQAAQQPPAASTPAADIIQVVRLRNGYYPQTQFREAPRDACPGTHLHSASGGQVFGLAAKDSTTVVSSIDPAPTGCGFGGAGDMEFDTMILTDAQVQALAAAVLTGR